MATFQVGIAGTDGIILASDTRVTKIEGQRPYSTDAGQRVLSASPKIIIYDDEPRLAYCWAGGETQTRIAGDVARSIRGEKIVIEENRMRELLSAAGHSALSATYPGYPNQLPQGTLELPRRHSAGSVIIAYSGMREVELWKLSLDLVPDPCRIMNNTAAGDAVNPGIFFMQKYYEKIEIDRLLPVAAHTVLMCSAMNKTGIDGLEIVVCRQKKFRKLEEQEIAPLCDFSKQLDESISKELSRVAVTA
jgi:hypothetical protein